MTSGRSLLSTLLRRRTDSLTVIARARAMFDALGNADRLFHPSAFWGDLVGQNLKMIEADGVENFKRSVTQNYFNWPVEGPADPQMRALLSVWAASRSIVPLAAELHGSPIGGSVNQTSFLRERASARAYTLFVGLLWWHASQAIEETVWRRLGEPQFGNPVRIELDGRLISQDLANSLRECGRLQPYLVPAADMTRPVLAEIGAGYGRLGCATLHQELDSMAQ